MSSDRVKQRNIQAAYILTVHFHGFLHVNKAVTQPLYFSQISGACPMHTLIGQKSEEESERSVLRNITA